MNEHPTSDRECEPRVGERVMLGGRIGVLRYVRGTGAVVRFDHEESTKVVPLRRLVAYTDEPPLPGRG